MEKIINKLIDEFTKGVDTYTHNGSTWLIFTESKQWVIELTESRTLWYNYNFFNGMFAYTSMDVVENQHYITKWVEDNVINKNQVNLTKNKMSDFVSDSLIENGVKENSLTYVGKQIGCEDALENGVRHTEKSLQIDGSCVIEDTVQNGVKETRLEMNITEGEVDDIIQDGVKLTQFNDNENKSWVEGVIKEGVKETNHVRYNDVMGFFNNKMEDTLQNGVRHTLNTEYMPKTMVEDIIENGVKETKTPGKDGDILSTIEWMEENKSTSYTKMIDDVIDNGVKETKVCNYKDPNTNLVYVRWPEEIDEVIDNGVKKTMLRQHITDGNVETIIETGIKEVQPLPDQSGELIGYGNYYKLKEDRTKAFIDYLEETIKFGVKN